MFYQGLLYSICSLKGPSEDFLRKRSVWLPEPKCSCFPIQSLRRSFWCLTLIKLLSTLSGVMRKANFQSRMEKTQLNSTFDHIAFRFWSVWATSLKFTSSLPRPKIMQTLLWLTSTPKKSPFKESLAETTAFKLTMDWGLRTFGLSKTGHSQILWLLIIWSIPLGSRLITASPFLTIPTIRTIDNY